jgi:hypothetical protein
MMSGLILLADMLFPERQGYAQENLSPTPDETPITKASSDKDLLKATQYPVADGI